MIFSYSKVKITILTYTCIFSVPVFAFNLNDAWQAALNHSAEFSAARHNRDAEAEQKHQARAALLPQVTLAANHQAQPSSSFASERSSQGWRVGASQVLFNKSRFAQYKQGRLAEEMAGIRLKRSEAELRMNVARAYFDVLLNKDKLVALRSEKAAYAHQLEQAKAMFEAGAATILDTYEAQAGYDAALAKEIETLTALQTSQNTLLNLTGLNPDNISPLKSGNLPDLLENSDEIQWQESAKRYNLDWQLQRKEVQNAHAALQAEKGARLPVLVVNGSYQDNRNIYRNGPGLEQKHRNKGSSFSIQLSMPLFSGGRISSSIRAAASREMQNKDMLTATERNIRLAVRQAYTLTKSSRIQILAQHRLLKTNQVRLEATQLGRQVGVRNNLEETQAQRTKAEAEQKLAEAKYNYIQAYLQLLQSSGLLNDENRAKKIATLLFYR